MSEGHGMTFDLTVKLNSDRKCQVENLLTDTREVEEAQSVILDLEGLRNLAEQIERVRERLDRQLPESSARRSDANRQGDGEAAPDVGPVRDASAGEADEEV